jgi:hypothetical protein
MSIDSFIHHVGSPLFVLLMAQIGSALSIFPTTFGDQPLNQGLLVWRRVSAHLHDRESPQTKVSSTVSIASSETIRWTDHLMEPTLSAMRNS